MTDIFIGIWEDHLSELCLAKCTAHVYAWSHAKRLEASPVAVSLGMQSHQPGAVLNDLTNTRAQDSVPSTSQKLASTLLSRVIPSRLLLVEWLFQCQLLLNS